METPHVEEREHKGKVPSSVVWIVIIEATIMLVGFILMGISYPIGSVTTVIGGVSGLGTIAYYWPKLDTERT
jgi:hypothetical protein